MAVREVAIVATVSTDRAGVILGYERVTIGRPDVCHTRHRPRCRGRLASETDTGFLCVVTGRCFGSDSLGLSEGFDLTEAVANEFSDGDVLGVAPAVVPSGRRPELAELCASVQPVPVEPDDIGRWIAGQRWSGHLLDRGQLLRRTATEDVDASTTPVCWVGKLVCELVGVPVRVAEYDLMSSGMASIASRHFGTITISASG